MWPEPDTGKITYFNQLITLNLARKDFEAADATFREMQENFPERYTTFISEAEIYLYQGDFDKAITSYFAALGGIPNNRRLYL